MQCLFLPHGEGHGRAGSQVRLDIQGFRYPDAYAPAQHAAGGLGHPVVQVTKALYQHAPMSPSSAPPTPDSGPARVHLVQVLAAMEDPKWAQLTNEIAAKDAKIEDLWALKRTADDQRTRADLTEQLQQLQADKQGLLDQRAGMVKECLHQQP